MQRICLFLAVVLGLVLFLGGLGLTAALILYCTELSSVEFLTVVGLVMLFGACTAIVLGGLSMLFSAVAILSLNGRER